MNNPNLPTSPHMPSALDELDVLLQQTPPSPSTAAAAPVIPSGPVAPPTGTGDAVTVTTNTPTFELDTALHHMVNAGGSDLHVTVAAPPAMRLHGTMEPVPGTAILTDTAIRAALYPTLTSKQQATFEEHSELDFAYTIPGVARFRANIFVQKGHMGAVFRAIPWELKTLSTLGMPPVVSTFAHLERGFVLVAGVTGSGKSTTLASIVDEVNRTRSVHIMTVEDPIEFTHTHKKSIINQREVGNDTHSFTAALRHVLRQDPDVILVGEMRDLETISVALTAAETGHLVFGTLHTSSAAETVSRIVDVFPPDQQAHVRTQLAATLQAVICQTLVKRRDGNGRAVAAEIMVIDDAISNQIRKGNLHQIQSSLQTGAAKGMQTMDKHLAQLTLDGTITYTAGLEKAVDRNEYEALTGGEAAVTRHLHTNENNTGHDDYRGSM